MKKRTAFTLAEVLITLGIIGVVAAMTMPTLIQKHQKQAYVTGFKKGVSVIENMLKKMQADEGVSSLLDTRLVTEGNCAYATGHSCEDMYGNPSVFENLIPKYIKTLKVCKGTECPVRYSYARNKDDYLNFSDLSTGNTVGNIMYRVYQHAYLETPMQGFYTNDGAIYYISPGGDIGIIFVAIDSNGEKGPNILGRDLLTFSYKDGKITYDCQKPVSLFYWPYVHKIIEDGWKMNY